MKKRILLHFAQVLTVTILALSVILIALTYGLFEQRVAEDLRADGRALASLMDNHVETEAILACSPDIRLTFIDASGTVRFDNRRNAEEMDSHEDRPEVTAALESGEGVAVRRSDTLDENTFYFAVRLRDGSVLRVAKDGKSILGVYLNALPLIGVMLLAMLGVSVLTASKLTDRLIDPIRLMTRDMLAKEERAPYPELRPVARMLRRQHEELINHANMRVQFTANVSHELKTPLTSISGYAELIENGMAQGEQAARFAGEIHRNAQHLLTMIDEIIKLSKMDNLEYQMETAPVDLAQAVHSVARQIQSNAAQQGVDIQMETRPGVIEGNQEMIEELCHHLLDNAIRYNVRGGSVRVEVRPVRDQVLLLVQDTGVGIDEEHLGHVFERFYRVDQSRSKATGGTGLGLAIVKHIAAKHQATIALQSEAGKGTTVTVTFRRMDA